MIIPFALCLAIVTSLTAQDDSGRSLDEVDEVEYVTYRVITEYEIINKNNGSEPQCKREYESINHNHYIKQNDRLQECENIWGENVLKDIQVSRTLSLLICP